MIRNLLFLLCAKASLTAAARFNEPANSPSIEQSFRQRFLNAKEVQWRAVDGYHQASFWKSGQYVQAVFSTDGELMATARKVSPLALPVMLQAPLRAYAGYWVDDATELCIDDEIEYLVTLRRGDETLVLRSDGAEWKSGNSSNRRQGLRRLLVP